MITASLILILSVAVAKPEINELMYNPTGDDYDFEFIEIYFGEEVNVSGWYFEGVNFEFGEGNIVDGYVVIANTCSREGEDNDFVDRYGGTCRFEYVGTLNNNGEKIALYDNDGNRIDSVEYSPELGGSKRGSLEKQSNGSWIESEDDCGSPGKENSCGIGRGADKDDEEGQEKNNGNNSENDSNDGPIRDEHEFIKTNNNGSANNNYVNPEPIILEMGHKSKSANQVSNQSNESSNNGKNNSSKKFASSTKKSRRYGLYILTGILILVGIYFILRKK